jgi:hypothetical protein
MTRVLAPLCVLKFRAMIATMPDAPQQDENESKSILKSLRVPSGAIRNPLGGNLEDRV